jgi:hypothetical protein
MPGGHYWCGPCDEPAFGPECQRCHRPAEFIQDERTGPATVAQAIAETRPGPDPAPAPKKTRLSASEWFRLMREEVAKIKN